MIIRYLLAIVTFANGIRLIGGSQRTIATFNGELAVWHYLPGIGDAIAGLGALILAVVIVARGLVPGVRRSAWSWNVFGAIDLMIAMPINVLFRPEDPRFFTPVLALTFLACHVGMMLVLWFTRDSKVQMIGQSPAR